MNSVSHFQTIVAMFMTASSSIESLIDFFSFTAWIVYGTTFALLIFLRIQEPGLERPFKVSPVLGTRNPQRGTTICSKNNPMET